MYVCCIEADISYPFFVARQISLRRVLNQKNACRKTFPRLGSSATLLLVLFGLNQIVFDTFILLKGGKLGRVTLGF